MISIAVYGLLVATIVITIRDIRAGNRQQARNRRIRDRKRNWRRYRA